MKQVLAVLLAAPLAALAADPPVDAGPYVPSPQSVVSDMLKLAEVGPQDFVIDLGSGDGRIVRTAALIFGARGLGVEIKDALVRQSNADARREGIADRVKFINADLFKIDISPATVLTMYLLPDTVNLLKPKLLAELRPGTRVLSHDYPLSGWIPEKYVQMDLEDKVRISGVTTTLIYLYVVPAKVAGHWTARVPSSIGRGLLTLNLSQQITRVTGTARVDGRDSVLEDVRLRGDALSFTISGRTEVFAGVVKGRTIEGQVESGTAKGEWAAALDTNPPSLASEAPSSQATSARPNPANKVPAQIDETYLVMGSGFVVTKSGHVVTNAHVVEHCRDIEIRFPSGARVKGQLLAKDQRNDLALLASGRKATTVASFRTGSAVEQGESVVAFGFPLAGVLASSGNATAGNITALAGIKDDSRLLQISAPIQAGNSGGPLLDMSGNVVGIVVASLDALKMASATGDIPQNVNFAIRGSLAQSFLQANGLDIALTPSRASMKAADVTKRAQRVAVQVSCQRNEG